MLEKIRQFANHSLFKFLFIIIAIAFALSLKDFSNPNENIVLQVGNEKISIEEFNKIRQQVINNHANQSISQDQIEKISLYRAITKTLLNQEIKNLGIKFQNETIADYVRNDKSFHKNGDFDYETYKKMLSDNNLNETTLIEAITNQIGSKFILDSIFANMPLKNIYNDYFYNFLTEKRDISLISINTNELNFTSYDDAELRNFYEKNHALFQTKEKRDYSYILLETAKIKKSFKFPETEIFNEYENNISNYALPETRDFSHFLAPNKEIAEMVATDLTNNLEISEITKKYIDQKVIGENFTNQSPSSFITTIDPKLFEMNEGEVSSPVKSDLGWHVFKINKIHPRLYKSFAQARSEVEEAYKDKLAEQKIYELSKQIEDDLASGLNLAEIAKNHDLSYTNVEDANGNDPITVIAFQTQLNEESNLTQLYNSQDYVLVRVNKITPTQPIPYEEAINKVKEAYSVELKQNIATETANSLRDSYTTGGLISDNKLNSASINEKIKPLCERYKISCNEIKINLNNLELLRPEISQNKDIPIYMVSSIFALKSGDTSPVQIIDSTSAGFAVVNKIITDSTKNQQLYNYVESVGEERYKNALYDEYIEYLKSKYTVKINYNLLKNKEEE